MSIALANLSRKLRALMAPRLSQFADELIIEGPGIFQPTATTSLLLRVASQMDLADASILDLGCGWGIIGLELALAQPLNLSMSDMSLPAVNAARRNCLTAEVRSDIRLGNCLDPWQGERFDLIISDVSGVSDVFPDFSRWFDGVPADSGRSGHRLTDQVLKVAHRNLEPGGGLLVPLISLSDRRLALKGFSRHFSSVTLVGRVEWILPDSGDDTRRQLLALREIEGVVDFREIDGQVMCWTEVYELRGAKNSEKNECP